MVEAGIAQAWLLTLVSLASIIISLRADEKQPLRDQLIRVMASVLQLPHINSLSGECPLFALGIPQDLQGWYLRKNQWGYRVARVWTKM